MALFSLVLNKGICILILHWALQIYVAGPDYSFLYCRGWKATNWKLEFCMQNRFCKSDALARDLYARETEAVFPAAFGSVPWAGRVVELPVVLQPWEWRDRVAVAQAAGSFFQDLRSSDSRCGSLDPVLLGSGLQLWWWVFGHHFCQFWSFLGVILGLSACSFKLSSDFVKP